MVKATDKSIPVHDVILRPRVTERSSLGVESGVYTFEVDRRANKKQIFSAVKAVFGVSPIKVNIVNIKGKSRQANRRGRRGKTASIKKAVVFLRKGDKIEVV